MIRQYKLTNGDEILAKVEEFDEEENLIIARNVMKIISVDDHKSGIRYYSLRPWMVFQDESEFIQTISYGHVIGEAKPNQSLLNQYFVALKTEIEDTDYDEDQEDLDDFDDDEEETNVISFNKDKLH